MSWFLDIKSAVDVLAITRARNGLINGRVKALREQARLSQAELARALDVSPALVSRWESLERRPGAAAAERLDRLIVILENAVR